MDLEKRIGFWAECWYLYREHHEKDLEPEVIAQFAKAVGLSTRVVEVVQSNFASAYIDLEDLGARALEEPAAQLVGKSVAGIYRLAEERSARKTAARAVAAAQKLQQEREAVKAESWRAKEEKRKWLDRPEKEILWELHQRILSLEERLRKVEFSTAIIGD